MAKFSFGTEQNVKVGFTVKNEHHYAEDVLNANQPVDRYYWRPEKRKFDVINSSFFTEYALRINPIFRFVLSASYDRHDGIRILNRPYIAESTTAPTVTSARA